MDTQDPINEHKYISENPSSKNEFLTEKQRILNIILRSSVHSDLLSPSTKSLLIRRLFAVTQKQKFLQISDNYSAFDDIKLELR